MPGITTLVGRRLFRRARREITETTGGVLWVRSGLSSMRPRIIGGNGNLRCVFFPATATERMSRRHAEKMKLS
jgi:hypothetical protein